MIQPEPILVTLVRLVDWIPEPPLVPQHKRGRPKVYADRLIIKALIIMIIRRLYTATGLLNFLEQETALTQQLRELLTQDGRFPTRRTWERRLKTLPDNLPQQIGSLGRLLVELLQPWQQGGRAVAVDSTPLRADMQQLCQRRGWWLAASRRGQYPHTDSGVEVRRIFHKLRSQSIEPFNGLFKNVFEWGGQVPVKGLWRTQLLVLGAVLLYQLVLLYQFQLRKPLGIGIKALLRAA